MGPETRGSQAFGVRPSPKALRQRILDAHSECAYNMRLQMEHRMSTSRRGKKAVNVSISADLLQAARSHEINLSATLEAAVEHELRRLRKRDWLEQNGNAIQAYNRDVEEQGAFSDGLRTF
jgi:antitoxin CcdA